MRPIVVGLLILAQVNPSIAWGACLLFCDMSVSIVRDDKTHCATPGADRVAKFPRPADAASPCCAPARCSLPSSRPPSPSRMAANVAREREGTASTPCCVRPSPPRKSSGCCSTDARSESPSSDRSRRSIIPLATPPHFVRTTQNFQARDVETDSPFSDPASLPPCCNCPCVPVDAPDALPPPAPTETNRHEWLCPAAPAFSIDSTGNHFPTDLPPTLTEIQTTSHGRRLALLGSWLK
jgi:hypothetical protein